MIKETSWNSTSSFLFPNVSFHSTYIYISIKVVTKKTGNIFKETKQLNIFDKKFVYFDNTF